MIEPWWDGETVVGTFLDAHLLRSRLASEASDEGASSLEVVGRREAIDLLEPDDFWSMNHAFHLADWDRRTRFCGRCGEPTERDDDEIAKVCPACDSRYYPQIAPAVIMAVVKDGTLLLAHNRRHPGRLFSVLAGFVEVGETLEHAVSREVFEEAGVLVRDIEYFSSQPWPFPNSLMVAFTAEYAGGTIRPDRDEIEEIGWFTPQEIPDEIPGRYSVARSLIEWFVGEYGTSEDLRRIITPAD
ncbi:MAG: NAD(+) diphosphatase [Spirochaetales bacterium]|nr:NAD(+) diphosphatase [Spirochaetales bacterium]